MKVPTIQKHHLLFGFLFGVYLTFFLWQRWTDHPDTGWKHILEGDGKGHYSYLPHLFIEGDLHYEKDEMPYAVPTEDGHYLNRFYGGTAILEIPFFFLGYITATIFGFETDGYSEPFAFFLTLAAIFYVLTGFYLIYKILTERLKFNPKITREVILLCALGTPIIYYATIQATYSHAYSFFALSLFIFQFYRTIEKPNYKNIFLSALILGLIAIIRPVNVLVILLLPYLFENWASLRNFLKKNSTLKNILMLLMGGMIPVFIQCWLWFMQNGNWMEWSYKQEGFYFTKPEIINVLFSFRRGLFIYTPLLLITMLGFYFWWKENRFKAIWLLAFFTLFTYVISSWWHWTYGDTFGIRPFNDILFLFIILLVGILHKISSLGKKIILFFSYLFAGLHLVYAYQFSNGIITANTMDREKFMVVFLKTDRYYRNLFGGAEDIPPYAPNGFENIHHYKKNFADLPKEYLAIDREEFPLGTEFQFPKEKKQVRHQWIEVRFKKQIFNSDGMNGVLFIIQEINPTNQETVFYSATRVKEFPQENVLEWKDASLRIWLPHSFQPGNLIKLYFWNKGKEKFNLDEVEIKAQVPKW